MSAAPRARRRAYLPCAAPLWQYIRPGVDVPAGAILETNPRFVTLPGNHRISRRVGLENSVKLANRVQRARAISRRICVGQLVVE